MCFLLTHLNDHGDGCAGLLVPAAGPRSDDGSLADLLLRLLGDEDAALRLGRRLRALDQHAVEHRQESLQGARLEKETSGNQSMGRDVVGNSTSTLIHAG